MRKVDFQLAQNFRRFLFIFQLALNHSLNQAGRAFPATQCCLGIALQALQAYDSMISSTFWAFCRTAEWLRLEGTSGDHPEHIAQDGVQKGVESPEETAQPPWAACPGAVTPTAQNCPLRLSRNLWGFTLCPLPLLLSLGPPEKKPSPPSPPSPQTPVHEISPQRFNLPHIRGVSPIFQPFPPPPQNSVAPL